MNKNKDKGFNERKNRLFFSFFNKKEKLPRNKLKKNMQVLYEENLKALLKVTKEVLTFGKQHF